LDRAIIGLHRAMIGLDRTINGFDEVWIYTNSVCNWLQTMRTCANKVWKSGYICPQSAGQDKIGLDGNPPSEDRRTIVWRVLSAGRITCQWLGLRSGRKPAPFGLRDGSIGPARPAKVAHLPVGLAGQVMLNQA
jgi:hypothetical protein